MQNRFKRLDQLQGDDLADQAPPAERRRVTPETVIKRKHLKRQREPTAITVTSSEKAIHVLGVKNLERQNKEKYDKAQLIHGATEGDKSPALCSCRAIVLIS